MLNLFIVLKGALCPKFALPLKKASKLSFVKKGSSVLNSFLNPCSPIGNFNVFQSKFKAPKRVKAILSGQASPTEQKFCNIKQWKKFAAFSLVEMLMALLVASLLLAALAPVLTRKMNESIGIKMEGEVPGKKTHIHEIKYADKDNCSEIEEKDGYSICKGTFSVPPGYNGALYVTATGGGGGGGTSATTGTKDFTVSSTGQQSYDFVVPPGVTEIEVTMVSGGAGGGGGGLEEVTSEEISNKTGGVYTWSVPDFVKGKNVLAYGCGGGGGGGGTIAKGSAVAVLNTYGNGIGGAGGYRTKQNAVVVKIPNINTVSYQIGGGGGGAGNGDGTNKNNNPGSPGNCGGGGDGGADDGAITTPKSCNPQYGPQYGGAGGTQNVTTKVSTGGGGGIISDGINRAGTGIAYMITGLGGDVATGGQGSSGGNGGSSGKTNASWGRAYGYAGGGGGGYFGGGGGGGSCIGPGGGGGGPTYFYGNLIASGGGGGGGGSHAKAPGNGDYWQCPGGGGGGGGGLNGGAGGVGAGAYTQYNYITLGGNGLNGYPANSTAYPSDRCAGGEGGNPSGTSKGTNGKDGILYVTYLGPAQGASGGGAGQIVPKQRVKVTPGETLTVFVGRGSKGGAAGYIKDDGTIVAPKRGGSVGDKDYLAVSKLLRGNTVLLNTDPGNRDSGQGSGPVGGSPTGLIYPVNKNPYHGCRGYITNGVNWVVYQTSMAGFEDFSNTDGKTSNGTTGGAGGTTTLFGNITCTPGAGGTSTSIDGKKGSGYGCGGGGGAPFGKGGDGTDGLVRITWNPDRIGYGGGGGSAGSVIERMITVKSGNSFKYQIASGGKGGKTVLENGKKIFKNGYTGGDTIFGTNVTANKIIAGGGYGGASPSAVGTLPDIVINNGTGGAKADLCKINTAALICSGALAGKSGDDTKGGGDGAASYYGAGGAGSKIEAGKNAGKEGAGGGSAGIRETDNINDYSYEGGKGGEGKIILKWYE